MKLDEITGTIQEIAQVKRIFGEPIHVDGVTIIPVARHGGGGGAGEGGMESEDGGGRGGGFGVGANLVGAYVVKDGHVTFVPAYDPQALATKVAVVAMAALFTWRSVAKARHKRKALQTKYRD